MGTDPVPWEDGDPRIVTLEAKARAFVILSEAQWREHILDEHPIMEQYWKEIVQTVANPLSVNESLKSPDDTVIFHQKFVGYGPIPGECRGKDPTLIILVNRNTDSVATVYWTDKPSKRLGKQVWP